MDKWEARHQRFIEQETRVGFTVDNEGIAVPDYRAEHEYEQLWRLHHQAMKLRLMWESRYAAAFGSSYYPMYEYVGVVIDQRLGLRKTLSSRNSKNLPKWVRCQIREQIDEIIAALDDIEEITT
jgi:hypothetical protein